MRRADQRRLRSGATRKIECLVDILSSKFHAEHEEKYRTQNETTHCHDFRHARSLNRIISRFDTRGKGDELRLITF
jgi:hypothetical protein